RWRHPRFVFVVKNDAANFRLQIGLVLDELLLQMLSRKLECHKLMMIVRLARSRKRLVRDCVVTGISGEVIAGGAAIRGERAPTSQVQTKLHAARVKCASPVKRAARAKVVPLNRDADLIFIPVEGTPTAAYFTPGVLLGRATRIHRV